MGWFFRLKLWFRYRKRQKTHKEKVNARLMKHSRKYYKRKEKEGVDAGTYIDRLRRGESDKSARDGLHFKR